MQIYLAARYSRRLELCGYRDQLAARGHRVKADWLNGEHQISNSGVPIGDSGEALVEGDDGSADMRSAELRAKFAADDFRDVVCCEMLIAFTEAPRSCSNRGGRHVELGIALGMLKRVWIVGPRENIFCWLEDVRQFDTFEDCLIGLAGTPSISKELVNCCRDFLDLATLGTVELAAKYGDHFERHTVEAALAYRAAAVIARAEGRQP